MGEGRGGGGSCYHKGQIRGEEGVKGNKINSINMADESDIWSTEEQHKIRVFVLHKIRKMHIRKYTAVATKQEWQE